MCIIINNYLYVIKVPADLLDGHMSWLISALIQVDSVQSLLKVIKSNQL